MAATKKFAALLFEPEGYIQQLHAAPGHVLPVLKTIADDPRYLDNPIIQKYPKEVDLMAASAAGGFNLGFEIAASTSRTSRPARSSTATSSPSWCSASCLNGEDRQDDSVLRRRSTR